MRLACVLGALAVAAGCGDKNDKATATGTVILQWDHTSSDRASLTTATLGERRSVNVAHRAKLVDGSTVELGLAIVTAPITLREDGVSKQYLAPVLVSAKLDKNADFTFSEPRCMGPNYQIARPTPREMILECRVKATKPTADVYLAFDVYGDGRVADSVELPPARPAGGSGQ